MEPDEVKPGDWIQTYHGLSQVIVLRQMNPDNPSLPDDHRNITQATGVYTVIYKTLCDFDGKPKLKRYMEGRCALRICRPVGKSHKKMIEKVIRQNPKTYKKFKEITKTSLRADKRYRGGDDLPTRAAIDAQIARIRQVLVFPPEGLTLSQIAVLFEENDVGFDFQAVRKYDYNIKPPYYITFINTGYDQTQGGLSIFHDYEIEINEDAWPEK